MTRREVRGTDCPLLVDGQPMYLRGRIDRIDVHESDGQTIVLDYKSGDSVQTPDDSHRHEGHWIDLQLPLYRRPGPVAGHRRPGAAGLHFAAQENGRHR